MPYSVHIVTAESKEGIVPEHSSPRHQRKLVTAWQRLGETHALGWCEGCEWFLRWPLHDPEHLVAAGRQHLGSAHFADLLAGRACIDPDLCDGGETHLRARLELATR